MLLFTPCMECCGHINCLRIPINREESNERKDKNHHGAVGKLSSEQQFRKSDTEKTCLESYVLGLTLGWLAGCRSNL